MGEGGGGGGGGYKLNLRRHKREFFGGEKGERRGDTLGLLGRRA